MSIVPGYILGTLCAGAALVISISLEGIPQSCKEGRLDVAISRKWKASSLNVGVLHAVQRAATSDTFTCKPASILFWIRYAVCFYDAASFCPRMSGVWEYPIAMLHQS